MKNTLRILLLSLGAAALVLPAVRAQDDAKPAQERRERGPGGGPGKMFERLAKELNLTADQQAKWKEIGEKEKAAIDAVPKEERRGKMRELNKTYADERRAVLTPEQQAKFDEMMAKMRERGPGKGKGEGHDAPPPPPADAK